MLLLVVLVMSFCDRELYHGGDGTSSNGKFLSSLSSEMYAALRASMSSSCLSLSGVTMFQTEAAGGLRTGSMVTASTGTEVGATVG